MRVSSPFKFQRVASPSICPRDSAESLGMSSTIALVEAASRVGDLSFGQPLANPVMIDSRMPGLAASSFAKIELTASEVLPRA